MSGAAIFVNPAVLAYMPKCVLAGLLIVVGYDVILRWAIGSARQLAPLEYLSLLAIAFIIIKWGFVPGVSIGVIFGCATFALSAGRVNAINFAFDGTEYRSSLDRGPRELALLSANGRELQGLSLQSYLFFGSANRLYQHIKDMMVQRPECRFLLFDFKLVTGIDSSATHSFTQIKQATDVLGARLVLVNLTPSIAKAFQNIKFISKDIAVIPKLDRALEFCENEIIAVHSKDDDAVRSLRDWLAIALGNADHAEALALQCQRLEFAAGDVIAQQGDASDSMHFILEGRAGIIVNLADGRSVRVRSLGPQTIIGEMGLITGRARSATVASIAYALPAEAFERLKSEHPELAQALLTYVIGVLAERLSFASRVIGILQR
jgi:sulfate permease, SulP family